MKEYINKLSQNLQVFKVVRLFLLFGFTTLATNISYAQLNPFGALYYQNQYLANPAMAGIDGGLKINLGYLQQWASVRNAPATQSATAQFGFANNMGIGINLYEDQAGVFKSTKVIGTYAYHLPLSEDGKRLSMGISGGFMQDNITLGDGEEQIDASVNRFNDRGMRFDGDIGFAYTGSGLTIQASVPNVMTLRNKEDDGFASNYSSMIFTAISYKTKLNLSGGANPLGVEPKLAYRKLDGAEDILDFGANFTVLNELMNFTTIFHTTNSFSLGVGVNYKSLAVLGMYTTQPERLGKYATNNFEVGLQFSLWDKK